MNDSCRYNKAIECSPNSGECSFCSWYPQEHKRRTAYVQSRARAIESRRRGKNGVMLKIRHKGKNSTYCLKPTRKSNNEQQSKTQHTVEKSTG